MNDNALQQLRQLEERLKSLYNDSDTLNQEASTLADKMYEILRKIKQLQSEISLTIIDLEKETLAPKKAPEKETEDPAKLPPVEQDQAPEPTSPSSTDVEIVDTRYATFFDGQGFAIEDTTKEESGRSTFVIEILADDTARFYPCYRAATRLLNSREDFITPTCDADPDITVSDLKIPVNCYGMLKQDAPGHWVITKKCRIAHI